MMARQWLLYRQKRCNIDACIGLYKLHIRTENNQNVPCIGFTMKSGRTRPIFNKKSTILFQSHDRFSSFILCRASHEELKLQTKLYLLHNAMLNIDNNINETYHENVCRLQCISAAGLASCMIPKLPLIMCNYTSINPI